MDPCLEKKNGRTHEPSLRELTSQLDALEKLMDEKVGRIRDRIDERDRLYTDRFKATDEKTTLALNASKEAITKAETATEKRFDAVNEFRGTLSDQAATLLPRAEALSKFAGYDEKFEDVKKEMAAFRESHRVMIGNLQQGLSASGGQHAAERESRQQSNWGVSQALLVGIALVGWLVAIVVGVLVVAK